jgi:hypothetical protein
MMRTLLDQWLDRPFWLRYSVYIAVLVPLAMLVETVLTRAW